MTKKIPERELTMHGKDRHKRSSALYKYLAFNISGLRAQGYGTRNGPAWSNLVALASKQGLARVDGKPLSVDVVRKVFARVSATLAAEERHLRTGPSAKRPPSRAQQGPRLAVAAPASIQTANAPSPGTPFAPALAKQEMAEPGDSSPEDLLAAFWRDMDKRSGR